MDCEKLAQFLARLTFREGVWLFPIAFVLHVLEESPQFPSWARHYASEHFTRHDYIVVHMTGVIISLLFPAIIWFFPSKFVTFVFFAFVFTPAVFFNVLFHAGATAAFGVYCPGLLTALTLYLPLYCFVSRLAFREALLDDRTAILAFVIAGVLHAGEVGHNVFKAW